VAQAIAAGTDTVDPAALAKQVQLYRAAAQIGLTTLRRAKPHSGQAWATIGAEADAGNEQDDVAGGAGCTGGATGGRVELTGEVLMTRSPSRRSEAEGFRAERNSPARRGSTRRTYAAPA
jgi:hypothetical protein